MANDNFPTAAIVGATIGAWAFGTPGAAVGGVAGAVIQDSVYE